MSTILAPVALVFALSAQPVGQLDPAAREAYSKLLKAHVKDGLVDYRAMEKSERPRLASVVSAFAAAKLPENRNERIAFYVDAYNLLVLASVIEHGRPRSVLDVRGFFREAKHTVAGRALTLDQLEKEVLGPFAKDPRTHFVVVCAAVGCPILEPTPFQGTDMEARMEAATRRYLSSPAGASVREGELALSKIFEWYEADFGGKEGVLGFVRAHLPQELDAKLGPSPKISHLEYNWTLNQR